MYENQHKKRTQILKKQTFERMFFKALQQSYMIKYSILGKICVI